MTERYRNTGDLLPGLVLPDGWADQFRKLLARIENADTPVNCLLAQERAEGGWRAWSWPRRAMPPRSSGCIC